MDAKEVLIMVEGNNKARALHMGIEEGINHMWTISALQLHEKAIIVADEDACAELKVATYKYYKDIEKKSYNVDKLIETLYKNNIKTAPCLIFPKISGAVFIFLNFINLLALVVHF